MLETGFPDGTSGWRDLHCKKYWHKYI